MGGIDIEQVADIFGLSIDPPPFAPIIEPQIIFESVDLHGQARGYAGISPARFHQNRFAIELFLKSDVVSTALLLFAAS